MTANVNNAVADRGPSWFYPHLAPEYRDVLRTAVEQVPPNLPTLSAARQRKLHHANLRAIPDAMLELLDWEDLTVPGLDQDPPVPVRVYQPRRREVAEAPSLLYLHGGGMWTGSIAIEHAFAARLCVDLEAVVMSVDYRLAPEHPYPAGLRDCSAALTHLGGGLLPEIDPTRVAIFGTSAGGGLALATALRARDESGPRACVVMAIYPMIDDDGATASSHQVVDVGPVVWDRAANLQGWDWYLAGAEADGYAAPARAADLRDLPPVFMDVGELDLFRDETLTFAGRLAAAGNPVELHLYPGAFHGCDAMLPDSPLSRRMYDVRTAVLRNHLRPRSVR